MPQRLLLWSLYFLVALGLGYPGLTRYDPRVTAGVRDSRSYATMVDGGSASGHHQYRVLIPYLARAARGVLPEIGRADRSLLALLLVNAAFVAWAALLLGGIGARVAQDPLTGVAAALLFLLSFNVVNLQLAGLVDSIETWSVIAVTWALVNRRWHLLPLIGAAAAAGKETSVVIIGALCAGWYVALLVRRETPHALLTALLVMGLAQAVVILGIHSLLSGAVAAPADVLYNVPGMSNPVVRSLLTLLNAGMLYTFAWLLPLGAVRLGRMPFEWKVGAGTSAVVTLLLSMAYAGGTNTARPMFSAAAPILLVSGAVFLSGVVRQGVRNQKNGPSRS